VSCGAELAALARASELCPPSALVAGLAVEVSLRGTVDGRTRCRVAEREPDLDAHAAAFLAECGPKETGAGLEPKLRVISFSRAADGGLDVEFAPTTWERGRGFHMALLARDRAPAQAAHLLEAALRGRPLAPGLAAVHAVVLTRDRKLVLMRRSASVLYRPSHWAATLEEQMVADDAVEPDMIARATLRGVTEELGVPRSLARTRFLLPLVETETLNVAFLSRVDVAFDSRELAKLAPSASDAHDSDRIAFVGAEADELRALVARGGLPDHAPLHPTSALRLLALARQLDAPRP
jgi:hypothetical protein